MRDEVSNSRVGRDDAVAVR